ncbi:hypothetical protein Bca4012_064765 [Brassica carinata]
MFLLWCLEEITEEIGIGSAHDAKVLSLAIEDDTNFSHPPDGKYYLGDSGYALQESGITSIGSKIKQRKETTKKSFNRCHSSLRSVIERTFGV